MKINASIPFFRLLLALSLGALARIPLHADEEGSTSTVKLSSPGKPATLKIEMPWADIHIFGADTDKVTVESTLNQKGGKDTRDDGLRRLDDEVSFELSEHENVVSLSLAGENPWAANEHWRDFRKPGVPRSMALDIKTERPAAISKSPIAAGDIEVNG